MPTEYRMLRCWTASRLHFHEGLRSLYFAMQSLPPSWIRFKVLGATDPALGHECPFHSGYRTRAKIDAARRRRQSHVRFSATLDWLAFLHGGYLHGGFGSRDIRPIVQ